ncbi:dTDP-4-dehydrorhamnose 3,5-epimerase family protein [Roseateles violae]|uniref:dTDP-4-dehydrorhamnose 3,5-epimerase n=1 Tax=Roseateles violae TaxID=3058042 RepID=A0ABT8DX11_9BURK|nr:dTDP-4-dehydrorhamnose 3,5-epimerase family protein [Pelomonas sp. PFR6]MDN3921589.1 dTDP-4-dehydrorhamnose 3,5-epimerase family protein [Pelomonas sp. PFR6]
MRFHPTPLAGLWLIETEPRGDARGHLTRLFCEREFAAIRPGLHFTQSNLTLTAQRGTVRGMHYQRAPALEAKLLRCLVGAVHDVVVDLRASSPTFGRWHAVELSQDNQRQLLIPEGCAHGFQTLTDGVQMLYQHTAAYDPGCEGGLRHDDPRLAIAWPLPVSLVSERDRGHPLLDDSFKGLPV